MQTITTTIRWENQELNDIKKAAHLVGLPVSLFLKSIALARIRGVEEIYDPILQRELLLADEEIENGEFDIFNSKEELIANLKSKLNK